MNTPDPITAYFAAANADDGETAAASFSPTAVVVDEKTEHRGRAEIREWVEEAARNYRSRAEILETKPSGNHTLVTARVSGNFPGSPLDLEFIFKLENGLISHLRIQ